MPEAPALEDFEDALDTEHEWPLIEGEKLRPTHVLRAHPIYFCQSYLDWSNFELENEPPPLATPIPSEERNDDFDKYLNDQRNEGWELGGHIIECANALATSPDAYRHHRNRWLQEQRRQQDQRVLEKYPNPIALRFGRFLAQRDTSKKRGLGACHIARHRTKDLEALHKCFRTPTGQQKKAS
tara:strand:+ start:5311 stop:5859 length:549 start_codon:yes stop_codon:yes gene_type:complete